ncbi:MAG: hypothetical protein CMM01_01035 [Rhodopirellula sp.]|nr:hypothetical protein [Rhodopirellula sp.]
MLWLIRYVDQVCGFAYIMTQVVERNEINVRTDFGFLHPAFELNAGGAKTQCDNQQVHHVQSFLTWIGMLDDANT